MASSRPAGGWRISWRYRLPNVAHRFGVRGAAMIHRTRVWLGASSGSHTSKKFRRAYWSLRTPRGGRRTVPVRRPSPRSRGVPSRTIRTAICGPYPNYPAAASFPAMDGAARTFRIGALAHRNFRLFFYGQGISLIGSWMQSVALGWLVLDLTNAAFAVGLNQALRSLGVLVCTLYAGIVVDRVDKRRLIVLTQALQMAEATAL